MKCSKNKSAFLAFFPFFFTFLLLVALPLPHLAMQIKKMQM